MNNCRFIALMFVLFIYSMTTVSIASESDVSGALHQSSGDLKTLPNIANSARDVPEKIKIFVSFFLFDISSINTADQTFKTDFRLQLRWHDPRLSLKSRNDKSIPTLVELADIWHPDIRFLNSQKLEKLYDGFLEIDEFGHVNYVQRYLGEFTAKFALKNFPIDTQILSIKMGSGKHLDDELEFVFDPAGSGNYEELTIADWAITPETVQSEPITFSSIDTSTSVSIPSIIFHFKARRHSGYYTWKVIIPLTLIVLMAFTVFWIDPAELSAQVTISTASVITVVAFQFSLGYLLPKISYLTRIDTFILGSTIFVFLALAESIITSAVFIKKRDRLARRIDLLSRWLFSASFILLFFISFVF